MERQAKDGTYYEKVGKDAWQPVTRTSKDGRVFRKIGENEWTPVEMEQPEKSAFEMSGRGLLKGAAEAAPIAGGLIGGILGAPVAPPFGMAAGGAAGAAIGKGVENFIESKFLDEPKTTQQLWMDPITEGAMDLGAAGALGAAGKIIKVGGKYVYRPARKMITQFSKGADVVDAPLRESAERLGVTPTRGMESGDPFIQKTESAIAQTPTPSGRKFSERYEKIGEGLEKGAGKVLGERGQQSAFQAGGEAKGLVEGSIEAKLKEPKGIYEKVGKELKVIQTDPNSMSRVAKNVRNLEYARIPGTPEAAFSNKIADAMESFGGPNDIGRLSDLSNLRKYVGQVAGDANQSPTMRKTAGDIYQKLARAEQNTITRAAIKVARNPEHGASVAKSMIGEIKLANKRYSEVSENLKEMGRNLGLGKIRNYADFIRKIQEMPDEKFVEKVFNPKNVGAMKQFKSEFPEAFESLRQAKLADIYNKSLDNKQNLVVGKLIGNARKLSPEYKQLVFGDDALQTLNDIETVYSKTYGRVGPSGTPEGIQYVDWNPLSPMSWYDEAGAYIKTKLIDKPGKTLQRMYQRDIGQDLMEGILTPKSGILRPQPVGGLLLRQPVRESMSSEEQ